MTSTMSRMAVAGCVALAALGTATVFDVGAPTAEAAPSASPFAGSWSGTWIEPDNGDVGTLDWTISPAGRLSGRVVHTQDGQGGAIVGAVRPDGFIKITAFAPSDDTSHGNGFAFQGTAVIDGDGDLVIAFTSTPWGFAVDAILERN